MIKIKAIIPVAGIGSRMRPHTHTYPKALLFVGGKPILGHIIEEIKKLGITEVILIVGYMANKIKNYCNETHPDINFTYVMQEKRLGLGHAISLAEPHVDDEPVLIIYGDTIFVGDISQGLKKEKDGYIGVKEVDDPRRFGVVEIKENKITGMIEKPDYIKRMPVIVGVNFINDSKMLFRCLKELVEKDIRTKNEYQLTDAFKLMIEKGADMTTFPLEGWYDCGKPETMLETNKYLLKNQKLDPIETENSVIIPPVYIEKSVKIKNSIIGPFVSIAKGAMITDSIIKDSIINKEAIVENAQLVESLIGENAIVSDIMEKLNVGDNSEIRYKGK